MLQSQRKSFMNAQHSGLYSVRAPHLTPHAQHIDGINLFGLISIASLLYCAPAGESGRTWSVGG